MRVSFLYDQGSARISEDCILFKPPRFFGAIDGVSGLYTPKEGPELFDGSKTGGQIASQAICGAFELARAKASLAEILEDANSTIRETSMVNGLIIEESEFLPAAAFVVADVGYDSIKIMHGGDCLAIWAMKDGSVNGISNPMFSYEQENIAVIARLMKKHRGDRQKMWEELGPILAEKRRRSINTAGGYAVLNGQTEALGLVQKLSLVLKEVSLLILFSDGFVPFEETQSGAHLAEWVVGLYKAGGLQFVLKQTREAAEPNKSSSHEDHAEATAIAIEF